jgi:hypothetical protein
MPRPFLTFLAAIAVAAIAVPLGSAVAPRTAVMHAIPAFTRARQAADRIPAVVARRAATRLRLSSSRRVALRSGNRVYVAPSADGELVCLVSSSADGEVGTACSPPATFTTRVGFAVLIRDSGPGTSPTGVFAAANGRVHALVLGFESSSRRVSPNADGGVAYTPAAGVGRLVSIASVDSLGRTIGILRVPRG